MRSLILLASTGLLLASCKDNGTAENQAVVGDNFAAEAIIANDTTAIDAATGDASNMAADVAFNVAEDEATNEAGTERPRSSSTRSPRSRAEPAAEEPAEADTPATPATGNET